MALELIEHDEVKPVVHFDGGAAGRIMVGNSLTSYDRGFWGNDVLLGASFAGVPNGAIPLRQGTKAWIAHEGGPGKDEAGIGGLPLADRFGVPAAAIATMTARLSGGHSLLTGTISRANTAAAALGVTPGMTGEAAAHLMLKAPTGRPHDVSAFVDERMHEILATPRGRLYACWSFLRVIHAHPDDVFCVGSHGAKLMALYALRIRPKGLICNDAGLGLDNSGIEGLPLLDKYALPAAAVSTDSARLGDPFSTYYDGVISAVNTTAETKGIQVGDLARDAAQRMLSCTTV
jgi:hypothetical protein